ncbi:MAG: DUF2752 domain-containing protein [Pedobacter sp.]|jgi:hypothetical protein|nr:MAG: DUF2752 domain-containing protein [Pedobacter sp.]
MKRWPIELLFWMAALGALAMTNLESPHYSLCPIANMGWDWCPGCGIGRAIAALMQGQIRQSFEFHVLGIPALILIIHRIWDLGKQFLNRKKNLINYRRINHV